MQMIRHALCFIPSMLGTTVALVTLSIGAVLRRLLRQRPSKL